MSNEGAATDVITEVDGHRHLLGGRCTVCATHAFPTATSCPRCGAAMTSTPLPRHGTVWSWTVQRMQPKLPYRGAEPFEPFAVGYIDLGPVRVESPLSGQPAGDWNIGDPVTLSIPDGDGGARFVFVPRQAAQPEQQP